MNAELLVLDFGIRAFHQAKPQAGLSVGTFVSAEIYLGVDPFFYFERFCQLPGMQPLIYSWNVDCILQQTPPFIETLGPSGQKVLTRDPQELGFKAITKTDAWKDYGGNGEYVLSCSRLDVPPKFEKSTRT
ncbi:MAG TPA: hypothetical protein VK731_08230 [Candidatus Cybelea sp.]|nr:hypothetical protein [Candidatus Cybelea sp.]